MPTVTRLRGGTACRFPVQECDNDLLMKSVLPITVVTAWLVSAAWSVPQAARQTGAAAGSPSVPGDDVAANRATIDRYCVGCHNERTKTGGLVLEKADLADVSDNAELWEK